MSSDFSSLDLPYTNLILVGFVGVGKTTLGMYIAEQLGVDFVDVDDEIEAREAPGHDFEENEDGADDHQRPVPASR